MGLNLIACCLLTIMMPSFPDGMGMISVISGWKLELIASKSSVLGGETTIQCIFDKEDTQQIFPDSLTIESKENSGNTLLVDYGFARQLLSTKPDDPRYSFNKTTSTLTISRVSCVDKKTFICKIYVSILGPGSENQQKQFDLDIKVPPEAPDAITTTPSNLTGGVLENNPVSATCNAITGRQGKGYIEWRIYRASVAETLKKDDVRITNSVISSGSGTDPACAVRQRSILTLPSLTARDQNLVIACFVRSDDFPSPSPQNCNSPQASLCQQTETIRVLLPTTVSQSTHTTTRPNRVTTDQILTLRIDISPRVLTEKIESVAHITCKPEGYQNQAREIILLEILKNEKETLVSVHDNQDLNCSNGANKHIKAEGLVDKDVNKSYLKVTLLNPTSYDTGSYTCIMYYMDENGVLKVVRASKDLAVQSYNLVEIAKNLRSLIENDSILKSRLDKLENTTRQQAQEIRDLKEKTNYRCAFYATRNGVFNGLSNGQVIVFNETIMKEGDGYNETIGVFTSPLAGLYSFHLSIWEYNPGQWISIYLMVNNEQRAELKAGQSSMEGQSSVSMLVKLENGDQVKPVVNGRRGDGNIYGKPRSAFSGYLVQIY